MKQLSVLMVLGLMLAGLAACETAEGLGRDMQNAGKAIEGSAEE